MGGVGGWHVREVRIIFGVTCRPLKGLYRGPIIMGHECSMGLMIQGLHGARMAKNMKHGNWDYVGVYRVWGFQG